MWGSGARLACPKVGGKRGDHPKGSKTLADGGGQWRACWDLEQDLGCRTDSGEGACSGKVGSRGRGQVGGATGAGSQAGARREPVLTPHLLFLCEVEAESPAPTLTAPACVVSGASCRLAVYQQGCWASLVHRFPLVTLSPGVLGSDPRAACPAVWEMLRTSRSCCRETGNSTARAGGGGGFQWVPDD